MLGEHFGDGGDSVTTRAHTGFMAKAEWNGVVIAESDDTVIVENNHYFPLASVRSDVLRPSGAAVETGRVRSAEPLAMRSRALQRGTLVHRLLQSLPDLPDARRREAAQHHLADQL